jgi:uncharacterized protein YpmS
MSQMDDTKLYWKIYKNWPKRIFWLVVIVCALFVIVNSLTHVDYYTDRSRVSELIVVTGETRINIEKLLQKEDPTLSLESIIASIPNKIGTKTKDGEAIEITYKNISDTGELMLFTPQLGVLLIFTPTVHTNGGIIWSCWGSPQRIVPATCQRGS